ncbi:MAG: sulfatase [Gemmatimonadales bacterium]
MSYRRTDILIAALWMGLVAGLLEGVLYHVPSIVTFLLRQGLRLGPDRLWLAAAANLIWFGLAAILIMLLQLRWPGIVTGARVLGALGGLAALSLVMIYTRMHGAAFVLIAIGVGTQTTRYLVGRDEAFLRFMRRTMVPLVGLFAVCAAGALLLPRIRASRTLAATPTPPPGRPNVLLIILDTVRGFNLSLHGYARATTPHLEERAGESVVFDQAMATASWTLPSHGSMFTGQYTFALSADVRVPLDNTYQTLAEVFTAQGYRTGGFVANTPYCSRPFGLGRGFLHYEDFPLTAQQVLRHSTLGRWVMAQLLSRLRERQGNHDLFDRRKAPAITDGFLAWSGSDTARPYFAFLNYYDAHHPYLPPAPYDRRFAPDSQRVFVPWDVDDAKIKYTPAMLAEARNAYDGAIGYLDEEMGRLFDSLATRGALDNTIVILTADHGEHLGEHGLTSHGNSVYRPVLQVPLLIRYPARAPGGRRISAPVTLRDIGATALDLADIVPSQPWPGASLRATWDSSYSGPPPSPVYAELRNGQKWRQTIMADGYQFYRDKRGRRALFEMRSDRDGEINLLEGDSAGRGLGAVVARLEHQLDSLVPAELRTFKTDTAETEGN